MSVRRRMVQSADGSDGSGSNSFITTADRVDYSRTLVTGKRKTGPTVGVSSAPVVTIAASPYVIQNQHLF